MYQHQHAHPLDSGCDCVAATLLDLRLTSTMSSQLVKKCVSMLQSLGKVPNVGLIMKTEFHDYEDFRNTKTIRSS